MTDDKWWPSMQPGGAANPWRQGEYVAPPLRYKGPKPEKLMDIIKDTPERQAARQKRAAEFEAEVGERENVLNALWQERKGEVPQLPENFFEKLAYELKRIKTKTQRTSYDELHDGDRIKLFDTIRRIEMLPDLLENFGKQESFFSRALIELPVLLQETARMAEQYSWNKALANELVLLSATFADILRPAGTESQLPMITIASGHVTERLGGLRDVADQGRVESPARQS